MPLIEKTSHPDRLRHFRTHVTPLPLPWSAGSARQHPPYNPNFPAIKGGSKRSRDKSPPAPPPPRRVLASYLPDSKRITHVPCYFEDDRSPRMPHTLKTQHPRKNRQTATFVIHFREFSLLVRLVKAPANLCQCTDLIRAIASS